ncbi:hypothetical protein LCGC14_1563690 [marine sediment metagenome]|uniref:Uncharacterized protein n=1 Tax=marine sediment metagenome TaxID=412755 RepID=A0A0F9L2X9_9ZZZZ
MSTYTSDRRARQTARLLERAAHFSRMAKAGPPSCRRRLYRKKDGVLAQAISGGEDEEFRVDSRVPGAGVSLGVTHVPSRRRFHIFPYQMPFAVQVRLHRLARRDRIHYPFMPIADEVHCDAGQLSDRLEVICRGA